MEREIPKLNTEKFLSGKNYHITKTTASFRNFKKEYYVQNFGTRAGVVIQKKNEILLVNQYRLLNNNYTWEVPGGKVNNGESPLEGAIRETTEETGFKCEDLKLLIYYEEDLDCIQNSVYIYSSRIFNKYLVTKPLNNEIAEVKWFNITDCINLIKDGTILDSFSIVAILSVSKHIGV